MLAFTLKFRLAKEARSLSSAQDQKTDHHLANLLFIVLLIVVLLLLPEFECKTTSVNQKGEGLNFISAVSYPISSPTPLSVIQ